MWSDLWPFRRSLQLCSSRDSVYPCTQKKGAKMKILNTKPLESRYDPSSANKSFRTAEFTDILIEKIQLSFPYCRYAWHIHDNQEVSALVCGLFPRGYCIRKNT